MPGHCHWQLLTLAALAFTFYILALSSCGTVHPQGPGEGQLAVGKVLPFSPVSQETQPYLSTFCFRVLPKSQLIVIKLSFNLLSLLVVGRS